jgi:hypothetical protein
MTSTKKEDNELNDAPETKKPKLWGAIYLILGIGSLTFAIATLIHSFGMVPLYGTVTAAVLVGALGIFLIIYGYRIFRKDY